MRHLLNSISSSLISKELGNCSLEELQRFSEKFPFSAPVQLLLAGKMKELNHSGFQAQWQKTLLYFNNPVVLNYLFHTPDAAQVPPVGVVAPVEPGTQTGPGLEEETGEIEEPDTDSVVTPGEDKTEQEDLALPAFTFKPVDLSKAELIFTPYHTVDYFASQGIKDDESKGTDRFSAQLKSFTNWLKDMKRLPEAENKPAPVTALEFRRVEEMAEKSLKGETAVTEAMAVVWTKQGNIANAIAVYQKLSLQIPAKRAYFAAKIEHLKKSL